MASKDAKRAVKKFENSTFGKIFLLICGVIAIIIALFRLLTTGSIR